MSLRSGGPKIKHPTLTQEYLKSVVSYDPETGIFTRLVATSSATKVGAILGTQKSDGYLIGYVNSKLYRMHRLAWYYMTGYWPMVLIDHINGVKNDNRWCNLREATKIQNAYNLKMHKSNTTGFKGVVMIHATKWKAQIREAGTVNHIGYFDSAIEAAKAYQKEAERLHGDFYYQGAIT